jgi:pimeloyl-ACP methyl ester carboxylesterase
VVKYRFNKITFIFFLFLLSSCSNGFKLDNNIIDENNMNNDLFYKTEGEGQPIILLHGFGADLHTWDLIKNELSKNKKVYTIDLLGHGESPKPKDGNYALSNQAELINDFILKNKLRNVILVGHSMGGAIALILAINHQETIFKCIDKIILIDSPAYKQNFPFFINLLRIPVLNIALTNILPNKMQTMFVLKEVFYDESKIDKNLYARYSSNLSKVGAKNALIETSKAITPNNINEIINGYIRLTTKTLIIWGEKDTVVPLHIAKRLHSDLKNSKLKIIKECGHAPQEEKPNEVIEAITSFTKERNIR